ncbi:fumarylacetoacetate hydrolase family protein [Halomonas alkaliantarctica]|uniref:Fumarylacetoacetate hydrolase family protein n=1 Tax=Halomonas alkaliantarctica TaxID=232346 RepID=A0ABY8LMW1_9GAMM|nr:fumarylacetoacetate hydrolase family protein [Halomonas alkaliantarctica]WGI25191.1 fumarylacetoacetate hydrolase family protein [Halomonas alkaliantarctica]
MESSNTLLGKALVDAWRSGKVLGATDAKRLAPKTDQTAYSIQREVGEALGWFANAKPKAWKVGGTLQRPTASPIADQHMVKGPFSMAYSERHTMIGIEVELAIQLNSPLPHGSTLSDAYNAAGSVMAAIEICDVRAECWQELPDTFLLADHQMNRCLILGEAVKNGWKPYYANSSVSIKSNKRDIKGKQLRHPLDDPLSLIPWLAKHAASQYPPGLQAGDIITTGTWAGIFEAHPGEIVKASFSDIGEVGLSVEQ